MPKAIDTSIALEWQAQLFWSVSNFAFGLPSHAVVGIYDRTKKPYKQLVAVSLGRLLALYSTIVTAMFTPEFFHWFVAPALFAASMALYVTEFFIIRSIFKRSDRKQFDTNHRINEFFVYFCVAIDPANFLFDTTATTKGNVAFYTHIAQVVVRCLLTAILISIEVVWKSYKKAWSCYLDDAPISHYTQGYCPAYTHTFHESWACAGEGITRDTAACRDMPTTGKWAERPHTFHVVALMLALLYGFHAASIVLDFKSKKMKIV
jgi:hypothetical protein